MLKMLFKTDFACTFGGEGENYVSLLHGSCTFNVPHLKIFVSHSKLEQLATLSIGHVLIWEDLVCTPIIIVIMTTVVILHRNLMKKNKNKRKRSKLLFSNAFQTLDDSK